MSVARYLVNGYRRGANIYVPKPEKPAETLAVFKNGSSASPEVLKALRTLGFKVTEDRSPEAEVDSSSASGGDGAGKAKDPVE